MIQYLYHMREWLSGRALPCQGRCRGFESRLPLQYKLLWQVSQVVRQRSAKPPPAVQIRYLPPKRVVNVWKVAVFAAAFFYCKFPCFSVCKILASLLPFDRSVTAQEVPKAPQKRDKIYQHRIPGRPLRSPLPDCRASCVPCGVLFV